MVNLLRIDASMRHDGSTTRELADRVEARFAEQGGSVARRDLTDPIPQIDEAWIGANFTDVNARSEAQKAHLALSDTLIAEMREADVILLAVPVYNFGVPAAFKAWIDQVTRARETFRYSEDGPVGLLEGKRAILVTASGGTEIGGGIDFSTPFVRHILGFIGITDVTVIAAGRLMVDAEAALAAASDEIEKLAA
ncbi:MAG: NAD(P)H-dependent oxidoreductase [Pseudomonadota bacterium]